VLAKEKMHIFFFTQVLPRYREQGKLLPQRDYIWDTETKGSINSEGKTRKCYCTCPEIFIASAVLWPSHLLKKNEGIIIGF